MDKNKIILYILYGLLIVVLGYAVYATQGFGLWKNADTSSSSSSGKTQAVFLSNGQVYFGELSGMNSQFPTLKNIFYLKVQKPIQPKSEDEQGKLTLVKLGNEIHGPVDEMKINREHILFVEDLKDDGNVMQSIKKYEDQGPTTTEPVSTTQPAIEE